ncbi:MAG TPA: D-alanyl-D-alanine carboxypeptidase family protein [Thermoleophilaceae bacterium]|nr:D-alanyl-D-alanine carboxypeptidase family protein [Thermoleophilaceae bacterium]
MAAGLAVAVAAAGVAAIAYIGLDGDDGARPGQPLPIAAGAAPPPPERSEPAEPAPVVPAEPAPDVPLTGPDAFRVKLRKPPRAALVFDVRSGEALWRRRPLRVLPMASLTKIMSALLVVERSRPREPVRITRAALRYQGSGVGMLPRGRRVRLETLLNGMLLVSGNDASIALAEHVSGSERAFVRTMNRRARELGLECTHFASSHGLEAGNRSCARDLAVLTRLAMERRRIRRVVRRRRAAFRFPIKGGRLYLSGHNPLIRAGYRGAIGLKTGYTDEAGLCFVGVARRGGRTLAVVLLHSANPLRHAAKLLDAGFDESP